MRVCNCLRRLVICRIWPQIHLHLKVLGSITVVPMETVFGVCWIYLLQAHGVNNMCMKAWLDTHTHTRTKTQFRLLKLRLFSNKYTPTLLAPVTNWRPERHWHDPDNRPKVLPPQFDQFAVSSQSQPPRCPPQLPCSPPRPAMQTHHCSPQQDALPFTPFPPKSPLSLPDACCWDETCSCSCHL